MVNTDVQVLMELGEKKGIEIGRKEGIKEGIKERISRREEADASFLPFNSNSSFLTTRY